MTGIDDLRENLLISIMHKSVHKRKPVTTMQIAHRFGVSLFWALCTTTAAAQQVEILRSVTVAGATQDLSGLKGLLSDGTPADRTGGPSGFSWTGIGQLYFWLSDRGPKDGITDHQPRFHEVDMTAALAEGSAPVIRKTITLKQENGLPLTGKSTAFDLKSPEKSTRFDPEGIALWQGKILVSDEYGPSIRSFDTDGKTLLNWPVPARFQVANPRGEEAQELKANKSGRQSNSGFEGLCTDGQGGLLAIAQRALLQDGALSNDGKRIGRNLRILQTCGPNCKPRELVYVLDDPTTGISEICHVGGSLFLSIERDSKPGLEAKTKKIMLFDIADATDVSSIENLPSGPLPDSIQPVKKRVFVDLLDPRFHLNGKDFPEKIEGLTFGPNLADGRRLMVVATDNDFVAEKPIRFWFFAVPAELLKQ